jgi:hypothetical protein
VSPTKGLLRRDSLAVQRCRYRCAARHLTSVPTYLRDPPAPLRDRPRNPARPTQTSRSRAGTWAHRPSAPRRLPPWPTCQDQEARPTSGAGRFTERRLPWPRGVDAGIEPASTYSDFRYLHCLVA